jgi:ComF family protein
MDLLFPETCAVCRTLLDRPGSILCPACLGGLERLAPPCCRLCGQPHQASDICPSCLLSPPDCQQIRSALLLSEGTQQAVWQLKLAHRVSLAPLLATQILETDLQDWDWSRQEILVPVPLHRSKLISRGFNQSVLLARVLAKRLRLRLDLFHLVRIQPTPLQSDMKSRAQRIENVRDAFAVRGRHPFSGRRICLVDDVVTTGGTLNACARALLRAGAQEVRAVTVARTPL